ncbi:unnamed protein product [Symbiodinium sp. CCMP2592]|nr:unnamed protein product [Symbiodinium sp. CCMP2592]
MLRACVAFGVALLAAIAYQGRRLGMRLGYLKVASLEFGPGHGSFGQPPEPPDRCWKSALEAPVEDLTVLDQNRGLLLGATGHVWECALLGAKNSRENRSHSNHVVLVDSKKQEVKALQVFKHLPGQGHVAYTSDPADHVYHGIFYSSSSRRLYAVCHRVAFTSVEVFLVHEGMPMGSEASEGFHDSFFLEHLETVRSAEFQRVALNDVVEAAQDGSSFFVTEWLDHDHVTGFRHYSAGQMMRHRLTLTLKARHTRLLKCLRTEIVGMPWSCAAATADRFVMANGLAITPDRRFLFLSDPAAGEVVIYRVESGSESLTKVLSFNPKHALDNLEVVESGVELDEVVLHGGSIPTPFTSGTGCEGGFGMTWPIQDLKGRSGFIGCHRSPGGLLEIRVRGLKRQDVEVQMQDRLLHDGSLLSDVSSAFCLDGRVVVGSPATSGLLFCDL